MNTTYVQPQFYFINPNNNNFTYVAEIANKDYPISFEEKLYDGMVNYNIH